MSDVTAGWELMGVVADGAAVDVRGVNPWDWTWRPLDQVITIDDPLYPGRRHALNVYRVQADPLAVVFAAAELAGGVWAFFAPST